MRIVGVPVRHGGPVQPRAEIGFHLLHEITGEAVEVRHLRRILGRDNEAEMMPVVPATDCKILCLHLLPIRPEQMRFLAVAGDAIAAQIGEVIGQRSRTCAAPGLSHHAGLDGDAAMGVEQAASAKPGMAPPEGRGTGARTAAFSLSGAAASPSARAAGGMEHLREKGPRPGRIASALDAARMDVEILVLGHQNLPVQENPAGKQHTIQNPAHDRPDMHTQKQDATADCVVSWQAVLSCPLNSSRFPICPTPGTFPKCFLWDNSFPLSCRKSPVTARSFAKRRRTGHEVGPQIASRDQKQASPRARSGRRFGMQTDRRKADSRIAFRRAVGR